MKGAAVTSTTIDVWNLEMFDEALLAKLNARRVLLRDYEFTAREIFTGSQGVGSA